MSETASATTELRAWALLVRAPGLDRERTLTALQSAGSAAALAAASQADLARFCLPASTREFLRSPDWKVVDGDLAWLAGGTDRFLVPATAADYPALLAQTVGAPTALYVRGSPDALSLPQLAMVGSRNPTASGRETAFEFARHFVRCGLAITSGLAEGIDAASHRGALAAGGSTIAVCGSGLDIVYPAQHADLAAEIAAHGALVSEFPPGTTPRREYFPQRNRIISALAVGTLVVEAARHSGSLITARHATEQGRDVFAIPGSIHSPLSRGCHQLIREGAKLVETGEDVLVELGMALSVPVSRASSQDHKRERVSAAEGVRLRVAPRAGMDKEYEILLDALGFDPVGVDALVERSGLKPDAVASMLLILELEGAVEARPGGRYCRAS
jgi:DNA processing protein